MIDIYEKQNAWFVSRGFSGYSHGERAEISLRGPGSVKFFLFDTEADNDTISVFGKLVTETAASLQGGLTRLTRVSTCSWVLTFPSQSVLKINELFQSTTVR